MEDIILTVYLFPVALMMGVFPLGITLARMMVAPAARIDPEVNDRPFRLGSFLYGGILLFQPSLYVFRLLLERFPYRLLAGNKTP